MNQSELETETATGGKRGKTRNRGKARETRVTQVLVGFHLALDWFKNPYICSDWLTLDHVARV